MYNFGKPKIPKLQSTTIGRPEGDGSITVKLTEKCRELIEDADIAPRLDQVMESLMDDNQAASGKDMITYLEASHVAKYLERMAQSYGCAAFRTV